MARRALLVLVVAAALAAALLPSASAYPALWVKYQAEDEGLAPGAPATCTGHPDHGEGSHGDPVEDDTITFALTDAAGKVATSVCPGADAAVVVAFPQPRFLLATSSAGALAGSTPSTLPAKVKDLTQRTCPNRWVHGMSGGQTAPLAKAKLTLTAPCEEGPVEVRVTSATGSASAYLQGSTKVPVEAGAACKPCVAKKPLAAAGNATVASPAAGSATAAAAAAAAAPAKSAAAAAPALAAAAAVVAAVVAAL
jgi:hypothetical protein